MILPEPVYEYDREDAQNDELLVQTAPGRWPGAASF